MSDVQQDRPYLSVVCPAYNEEESLPVLYDRLTEALNPLGVSYEVILINDGSSDDTQAVLEDLAAKDSAIKVIEFRRNFGQTAAMMAGIDYAAGEIIVMMDADLQNDPKDIGALLAKLEEGYDLVSGWRKDRKDAAIKRNFVSRVANRLISKMSGVHLHDYGCSLKAYRAEVTKDGWRLYGEMHRLIPIYASWMGAKIAEIPVTHHAREFGTSKYGLERIFKVLLDLMVVMFIGRYATKPIYVFGGFAFVCFGLSGLGLVAAIAMKIFWAVSFISTPLPMVTAFTLLTGILSLFLGLIAEILLRTYYESQGRVAYAVRQTVNLDKTKG